MRVAEAIGRAVARLGTRDFFGLVGSGNFHLANEMQASGMRYVGARHETGAVTMADAYARASGRLGECEPPDGLEEPAPPEAKAAPDTDVETLARWLETAERPLLLAGRGAVLSSAREPLERLADQTGALLATTAVADGLFAGNPWYIGISGGFASPVGAELIAASDLVVAFGASLNMWTTRRGRLIGPGAKVAQVDLEA